MNLHDQHRLVSAVFEAAASGVKSALKGLRPQASTATAPRSPSSFVHLTGSTAAKPVAARSTAVSEAKKPRDPAVEITTRRSSKSDFAHLVAMRAPGAKAPSTTAARSVPTTARQASTAAPSPAALSRAHVALASQCGRLASHTPRPSEQALDHARSVVAQQQKADAAAASEKTRAASVMAAKILAAGDYRGVRQP